MDGVSDHGRGRAENDVKKSPHGWWWSEFWMLDFEFWVGEDRGEFWILNFGFWDQFKIPRVIGWADCFWFQFKIHHSKFKISRRGFMDCVLLILCFCGLYECCRGDGFG